MGKYEGFAVAAGGAAEPEVIPVEGDTVTIPDAHLLFSGDFSRSGTDLVIAGEGQSVIVPDYFGDAGSPMLAAPNGAVLLPDVVSALAGPLAPGQYAQADDAQPAAGIGSVVTLTGSASAQRSDGTEVALAVDSRLAEGDVVQTGSGSLLGIVFDDGTVFNINADTRMVLDELVYEPGGGSNSMLFNVVQGVFAFVAGQVAPTGEMRVDTPVATMGVRGTSCLGQIEDIVIFRVVPDPVTNNVGACVLFSRETGLVMAVSDSLDTQLVFDTATGQFVEEPADPAHEDIIQRLHDTFVRFAGVPGEQDEDTQQAAGLTGSGFQTSFSLTPAEMTTIVALAGGAFPQIESLSGEPVSSGVDFGDEPEGGAIDPAPPSPPPPQPGSSDPQQPPPGGFTGDAFGSVEEDGTSTTTGRLVFAGGTGLIQPLTIQGTYGTFVIDANGNWVYTLDNDSEVVQSLGEGVSAQETFTVVSADGSETQFVTITVQGVNDVPTVTGTTTGAVVEDGTQVATGTIAVDDPDAGESSVQPQSNVAGTYGTFSILANGNWTYTLNNADPAVQSLAEGQTVTDTFTVTSFDGTVTETVTVTVTGTNDVPTMTGTTTGAVVEDGTQVATGTITVDDPDAGESSVQPQSNVAGTYGTFSILANGNWTYMLNNADPAVQGLAEGETVTDSFTVTSFDGTVTETITVTVTGTNDAPVAQNDTFATNENTAVNGNVLADNGNGPDEDIDGDPLTITQVNGSTANVGTQIVLASGALLLLNADGSFAYDPNGQFDSLGPGDSAQDSFTYTVSDGQGGSSTATVTLTINGVNDAPVATDSLISTNGGVAAAGMLTGMDVDSDTVTFSLEEGPQNGTVVINADGSYVYTPDEGATGQDSFTFRVTDGHGAFDIATVEIDIAGVGEAEVPKNIFGSAGNDVLIGSSLSDVLRGGPGDDILRSGGAPQTFFGLDRLNGGPGDDTLIAEGGAAILVGGPGNDVLTRVVTNQYYDWVRADYQSSPSGIVANLTGATIGGLAPGEVSDGFGTVDQVSFMHVIGDSPHDDFIRVDNTYSDGESNAIEVRLSGGNDTVVFDNVAHARIGYNHAGGGVWADLQLGTATDLNPGDNFIGSDTFIGKVHVLRGSRFDDVLLGSSGNDAFRGEGGDDYIDGRGGTNTIQFVSSSSGVHVDLSQNQVLNDGIWIEALNRHGIDEVYNIQNVRGSDWDDVLIGDAGNNVLRGGLGNDLLRSGGAPQNFFGQDRLFGGPGDDTLIAEGGWVVLEGGPGNDVLRSTDTGGFWDFVRAEYGSSPNGIVANLTGGSLGNLAPGEVADGFGTVDQVSNIHLIADSRHDDVIHVDSSYTNSFGNWIEVRLSGGNDTVVFSGVFGARISYAQALGPVLLDLEAATGTDRFAGDNFIGNDTFQGANSARGSRFDDEIYGRWEANDNLRGSGGDDYINGRGGTNTITFGDSSFGIHVDLSQNRVLDDGIPHHSLNRHGIDEVYNIHNVNGSVWDDLIIGDGGGNILNGGQGNDVLRSGGAPQAFAHDASFVDRLNGGAGNDTLIAEGGFVVLVGGAGNDVLTSTDTGLYYDWVTADYRTSPSGIVANLTGGSLFGLASGEVADGFGTVDHVSNVHVITGTNHDDVIHVDSSYTNSFGNWIEVRLVAGNDTVVFDGVATARISYANAQGPVLLDMEAGTGTDLNEGDNYIGNDTFVGANVGRGSQFDDVILGRETGNDELRGSGGDDYIDGRGGNNTITFSDSSNGIHVDLSQSPENRVLDDGIWNFEQGRNGIDEVHNVQNVRGSDFDDLIIGDAGDNVLNGGLGDDILVGGAGNDTLIGGPGNDTLEGGAGADRFGFRSPDHGIDSIIDFTVSEDVLVIDASVFGGGLVAGAGLSANQFVSGNAPVATQAHGQFLYDSTNGDLFWDVDGTGSREAVHVANLFDGFESAPNLTASDFELIGAGGNFVGSSQVAAAVDVGGEPVA